MKSKHIIDKLLGYTVVTIDDDDKRQLLREADRLLEKQWAERDIISYLKYTEEINPDLEEDYALSKMGKIREKYES